MKVKKVRDLTLVDLDEDTVMVIACDSCGGIGMKVHDALKVPPYYSGKFTARVALLEVMCSGAEIVTLTNAVCCEMDPTGRDVIEGIKQELAMLGIDDVVLTGSTEENFPTTSTGIGMTVVGVAPRNQLRVNNVKKAAALISIGLPKVGSEINLSGDKQIASYDDVKMLLANKEVNEMVPVGSKGILFEARQLAGNNNMNFVLGEHVSIDVEKSAGPATVVIAAVEDDQLDFMSHLGNVNIIGRLEEK